MNTKITRERSPLFAPPLPQGKQAREERLPSLSLAPFLRAPSSPEYPLVEWSVLQDIWRANQSQAAAFQILAIALQISIEDHTIRRRPPHLIQPLEKRIDEIFTHLHLTSQRKEPLKKKIDPIIKRIAPFSSAASLQMAQQDLETLRHRIATLRNPQISTQPSPRPLSTVSKKRDIPSKRLEIVSVDTKNLSSKMERLSLGLTLFVVQRLFKEQETSLDNQDLMGLQSVGKGALTGLALWQRQNLFRTTESS